MSSSAGQQPSTGYSFVRSHQSAATVIEQAADQWSRAPTTYFYPENHTNYEPARRALKTLYQGVIGVGGKIVHPALDPMRLDLLQSSEKKKVHDFVSELKQHLPNDDGVSQLAADWFLLVSNLNTAYAVLTDGDLKAIYRFFALHNGITYQCAPKTHGGQPCYVLVNEPHTVVNVLKEGQYWYILHRLSQDGTRWVYF